MCQSIEDQPETMKNFWSHRRGTYSSLFCGRTLDHHKPNIFYRLSVSLPVIAPICDSEVFAELKARKDDEESRCFLERIRRFTKVNIT